MRKSRTEAEQFVAWRNKGARRIAPRFPRPYGSSYAERAGVCEQMVLTVTQQFALFTRFGGQAVDQKEPE